MQPDLIDVVECAYDLRGTEAEWLGRVAHRVAPFFDHGLGMVAATFSLSRAGVLRLEPVVTTVSSGVVAATRHMYATAPPEALVRVHRRRVGLNWTNETLDLDSEDETARVVRSLLAMVGARTFYAVLCTDPTGRGAMVSLARRTRDRPPRAVVESWGRVAAHLAAGFRLVGRLGAVEAVMTPGGRLAHAEGPATGADAREALRRAAAAIDRSRGALRRRDGGEALSIWRGLVDGRWSLVDRFDRDGRRFLVAYRNDPRVRDPRALTPRERQVLGYVALGQANKLVAYTLGISESAVATHLSSAMAKLGLSSRVDLVAWVGRLAATTEDRHWTK